MSDTISTAHTQTVLDKERDEYLRSLQLTDKRKVDFIIASENPKVWAAYERMVNPKAFKDDGKTIEAGASIRLRSGRSV